MRDPVSSATARTPVGKPILETGFMPSAPPPLRPPHHLVGTSCISRGGLSGSPLVRWGGGSAHAAVGLWRAV
eukprot:13018142-Alexandrium_andersonii.AAC.1